MVDLSLPSLILPRYMYIKESVEYGTSTWTSCHAHQFCSYCTIQYGYYRRHTRLGNLTPSIQRTHTRPHPDSSLLFSALLINGTLQVVASLGRRRAPVPSPQESSIMMRRKIRVETLVLGLTFLALLDERIDFMSSSSYGIQRLRSTILADEMTNTTANVDKSENPWNRHFALLHPENKTRCAAVSMRNVCIIVNVSCQFMVSFVLHSILPHFVWIGAPKTLSLLQVHRQ